MKFENIEELTSKKVKKTGSKQNLFLDELEEKVDNIKDTYVYIKSLAKYYWVQAKIFFSPNDVINNILVTPKELKTMREYSIIETYDSLVYRKGGKEGSYNLLDENSILKPSSNPILHSDIKDLVDNVCGHKPENIEYLHKAILYKHNNLNDFTIPAVVFYGKGGSGKGTLMSLLGTIFGEDNTLANLGQKDLTGSFDTYRGQKLIVEFAEIATNNTHSDIGVLNKLKNIIGAEKIMVNEKGVRQYQTDNIAWFFISSNSNKPLQLDDKDKGNRRFTIIKSNSSLTNGKDINNSIRDIERVKDYLAWLYKTYPEVLSYNNLEALDNEDKKDLEDRSLSDANQFWEWLNDNFPDYNGKKRKTDIDDMINMFCIENSYEEREFKKFFWHNSKYPKKKIRIGDDTYYGVVIPDNKTS
ncbi:MAG: DUF5906 domain-containing protein [Candidatus Gracilibacteria bacterium]